MSPARYAIGIDFGTESGRAVLIDISNGAEVSTAIYTYANGVIDETLPGTSIRLEPDTALQDPNDYLNVIKQPSLPFYRNARSIQRISLASALILLPAPCCPL